MPDELRRAGEAAPHWKSAGVLRSSFCCPSRHVCACNTVCSSPLRACGPDQSRESLLRDSNRSLRAPAKAAHYSDRPPVSGPRTVRAGDIDDTEGTL